VSSRAGRAGASMVNITPPMPVKGYFGNEFRRGHVEADIFVSAAVFGDGNSTAAVISADIVIIGREASLWAKELCEIRTGIPASNIFINANHDHSAPSAAPAFSHGNQPDPLFVDLLVDRIATAVKEARDTMRPAQFAAGQARAPGVAFNRRLVRPDGTAVHLAALTESPGMNDVNPSYPPAGPVDDEVGYIFFEEPGGAPIGCILSFGCHNHSSRSPHFHRDMFGRAGDVIRQRLHANTPVVFLAGAGGDIMWVDPKAPIPPDPELFTWQAGAKLAGPVLAALPERPRRPVTGVRTATTIVELPDRAIDESDFCEDNCRGQHTGSHQFAQRRYGPEKLAVIDRGPTKCLVEIGALSLADYAAVSTNPAELFAAWGIEIKRRSPFEVTLISELTNGHAGYVPTPEGFVQGGYEAHRGVYVSRLEKDAGRKIVDMSVAMLEQCRNGGAAAAPRGTRAASKRASS